MPEGYTHIRTAGRSAQIAGIEPAHPAAFACGANGPDILFCYRVWRKSAKRGEDLPGIGGRLHDENTGVFLRTLIQEAETPEQRSYVLGFLCHYAADCVLHPYVVMITQPGQRYGRKGGHGYFEIALDSYLHKQDTGSGAVTVEENTPELTGAALAGAGALLQKGIQQALGITVSREALADTFWHTRRMRRMFVSRFKIKYALFWLAEPLFGGRGFITGHVTPARLRGVDGDTPALPQEWIHPFTGQVQKASLPDLLEQAERTGAAYMLAAQGYWTGKLTMEQVEELLGSASYLSGLPDDASDPDHRFHGQAQQPQAEEEESQPETAAPAADPEATPDASEAQAAGEQTAEEEKAETEPQPEAAY